MKNHCIKWSTYIWVCLAFLVAINLPYIISYVLTPTGYHYTGFLSFNVDNATYLSKMENHQGIHFRNMYNPTDQYGWTVFLLYSFIGMISHWFNASPILVMHMFRLFISVIFICSLVSLLNKFHFKKNVFLVVLFFVLFGNTGESVLYLMALGLNKGLYGVHVAQFAVETLPFSAALYFPHYILALTFQVLSWRYSLSYIESPKVRKMILVGLLLLGHSAIHPYSAVLTGISIGIFTTISLFKSKRVSWMTIYPIMYMGLIPFPYLLSMLIHFKTDVTLVAWNSMATLSYPGLLTSVSLYGMCFVFILYFSFQKENWNGFKLFLMIWIWVCILASLLPTSVSFRFLEGAGIPFYVLFGLWFVDFYKKKKAVSIIIGLLFTLNCTLLATEPIWGSVSDNQQRFISSEEKEAYEWLRENHVEEDVVMSDIHTSNFIPAFSKTTVFSGHNHETPLYKVRNRLWEEFVRNPEKQWHSGWIQRNRVSYIYINHEYTHMKKEALSGIPLEKAFENESITIYSVKK